MVYLQDRERAPHMWGLALPPIEGFTLLSKKGEGAYGVVYKALRHVAPSGAQVCAKHNILKPTNSSKSTINYTFHQAYETKIQLGLGLRHLIK